MKWFVYYDAGSCNDGDHMNDLEQFDTRIEAERRIDELLKSGPTAYDRNSLKLIEGRVAAELL